MTETKFVIVKTFSEDGSEYYQRFDGHIVQWTLIRHDAYFWTCKVTATELAGLHGGRIRTVTLTWGD